MDSTFAKYDMLYQQGVTSSSEASTLKSQIDNDHFVFLRLWDTFNV